MLHSADEDVVSRDEQDARFERPAADADAQAGDTARATADGPAEPDASATRSDADRAPHGTDDIDEAGSLLPDGEEVARSLRPRLAATDFALVLTSPRIRARRTAELAGFPDAVVDEDLVEWDYGDYEGLTTPHIREQVPGWTVWSHPCPGGETAEGLAEDVTALRARRLQTEDFVKGGCEVLA